MKLGKGILASVVGSLVTFCVLLLILFILIGKSFVSAKQKKEEEKEYEHAILKLSLRKPIVENATSTLLSDYQLPIGNNEDYIGLRQLKEVIREAKEDSKIKVLFLDLANIEASYAAAAEIRKELLNFKESGKKIYAYGEVMREKAYYLASVADAIYITPAGVVEFNGLYVERMFYKGLFEKLGVEPKIFRVGKYKSAVEPFFRKDMSAENEEQTRSFIESIYTTVLQEIAESRNMNKNQLRELSDSLRVRTAADAVKYKLIDGEAYYHEVLAEMRQEYEVEEGDEIKLVRYADFMDDADLLTLLTEEKEENKEEDHIAIFVAEGEIVDGRSGEEEVGSVDFASTMRALRNDESVKAIVLRINSPGGSALASDVMWKEIKETTKVKPVIASMGGLAASGGYYIAMACDTIIAHPATITGSIGVFGILANIQPLLEDKLGITTDRVKTGPYADLGTVTRDITVADSIIIQEGVNKIYEEFVSKAAEARHKSFEQLDEIASGRVWTGEQAVNNGLVDQLGFLDDAVNMAANRVGLDSTVSTIYYPQKEGLWGNIPVEKSVKIDLGTFTKEYESLIKRYKKLKNKIGIQTRLEYDLEVY